MNKTTEIEISSEICALCVCDNMCVSVLCERVLQYVFVYAVVCVCDTYTYIYTSTQTLCVCTGREPMGV